jgi:predicted nucleic acid-binding protein
MPAVFVDTTVLLRAEDLAEPAHQARCHEWLDALWATRQGRTSTNVLNDYYVAVTKLAAKPLTQGDARAKIRRLQLWKPVEVDHQTVETAWGIEARQGLDYWDALLVASAAHAGCDFLLTDRLEHGRQYGAVTVVNPFQQQPLELLAPDA